MNAPTCSNLAVTVHISPHQHDQPLSKWKLKLNSLYMRITQGHWRLRKEQRGTVMVNNPEIKNPQLFVKGCDKNSSIFVKWSLAWAQQQSEPERLHQRALEGNGGIKLGTAGIYRQAGCFFFFFPLGHCSICAPPAPLRASRQTHGQQALPSLLIGSCHGNAGSRCWNGGWAINLNMDFFFFLI